MVEQNSEQPRTPLPQGASCHCPRETLCVCTDAGSGRAGFVRDELLGPAVFEEELA